MHQDQAVDFETLEFVHRPSGGVLMAAVGICAAFIFVGIAGIWLGSDRVSSKRLGMLGGLAAIGVIGMIAAPWFRYASRRDVVTLGASDLSVREGSKVSRLALQDIESIDLSGEAGYRVMSVFGGGQQLQIREEWMDGSEAFLCLHTEVLTRQVVAS